MLTPRKLWRRLRSFFIRPRLDRELDDELRFHLEMETSRNRQAGLDEVAAGRRARLDFGPVEALREATRDARGTRAFDDLWRDLRHGARSLTRRPGFAVVVLSTLGLGVGGSAAIFGVVDGILLEPLPYREPDRIMYLSQRDLAGRGEGEASPANFLDWRERSRSFATLTAMEPFGLDWQSPEGPVYIRTGLVYPGFFETFGVAPRIGRTFRADEFVSGRDQVVVLGHGVWRTRFGGDPAILGRVLVLDGKPMTVVGVMPASFRIPSDDVVWTPKVLQGWEARSRSGFGFYPVFGRLQPNVTESQARAELDGIAKALAEEYPQTNQRSGIRLVSLGERMVGSIRRPLLLLLGAVVLVFAIVIANVTSLELARTIGRGREFAVRGALGAGRTRLIRQLVAESLCLAVLGAGIGFALAGVLIAAIQAIAPPDLPRVAELGASGSVLGFAIGASLIAALVTGIVPILLAGRRSPAVLLTAGGRTTALPGVRRLQVGLVVAQIGLSVVLLIGAGLLVRSFVAVLDVDRGFRTDGVAVLTVQSWSYLPKPADRIGFAAEVSRRLAARPGIEAAGMATAVPLMESIGAERTPLVVEGAPPTPASSEAPDVGFAAVTPGFFAVLGIPLREGRYLDDRDRDDGLKTAVVNEAFVRRHLDGIAPIGARIRLGRPAQGRDNLREIVGVVGNVRRSGLVDAAGPSVYVPHSQSGSGAHAFMVRSTLPPRAALEHIKQVIWELQPTIPVYRETTMAGLVGAAVRDRRFVLLVLGGFASLALVLAGAGIFGLMSFLAEERVREIGVRMALGATRGEVVGMLLRTGGRLAAVGIALGLVGAVAITRLFGGMLYQVEPLDPVTFVGAAAVLGAAALAATWFPANRAARTDPVDALRFD